MQRLYALLINFIQAQFSAGVGYIVDYALMYAAREWLGWSLFWSIALGGVVGAVVNFSINRLWVFRRAASEQFRSGLASQLTKFTLMVLGSILLKYLGTDFLERVVGLDYRLGKPVTDIFVSVLFNYTLQRYWVFSKDSESSSDSSH